MKKWCGSMLVGALLSAGSAVAQDETGGNYEIGAFGGFRSGGDFVDGVTGETLKLDEGPSAGMIVRLPESADSFIEILYSEQGTRTQSGGSVTGDPFFDMTVGYLHLGGMKEFGDSRNRSYLMASFGITRFEPDGPSLESETRFSFGLGAGYRYVLTRASSLRLEARAMGTAFNSEGGVFCTNGRCLIEVDSDALWQTEISLTFAVAF